MTRGSEPLPSRSRGPRCFLAFHRRQTALQYNSSLALKSAWIVWWNRLATHLTDQLGCGSVFGIRFRIIVTASFDGVRVSLLCAFEV